MSYTLYHTNGTPLVDLPPSENDGTGNLSAPIKISNITVAPGTGQVSFIVSNTNLQSRFIAGFTFSIVGGSVFDGTYTVAAGGATYTAGSNSYTTIPVVEGLRSEIYSVIGVDQPTNTFYVNAASACAFVPSTTFALSGNGNAGSNGTYTVLSSAASGTYNISGVDATLNSWRIIGDYTKFFKPGFTFLVQGNNTTGNGTYTVQSAAFATGETTITVVEDIAAGTNSSGSITVAPGIVAITVSEVVPVGTTASGMMDVAQTLAVSLVHSTAPVVSLVSPGVYNILFYVTGNFSAAFGQYITTGCEILIKDNNALVRNNVTVVSATYAAASNTTSLVVRYSAATMPVVTATGTAVIPPIPLPYGYIQYSSPVVSSPLQLLGKGVSNYNSTVSWGQSIQNNLIRLAENFANTTSPVSPLLGQLWFDTNLAQLWVRDTATTWKGLITTSIPSPGPVDMGGYKISNLGDATNPTEAVNLQTGDARYVNVTGDTMTGDLHVSSASVLLDGTGAITFPVGSTGSLAMSGAGSLVLDGTGVINLTTASNTISLNGGALTLNSTSGLNMTGSGDITLSGSGDIVLSTVNNNITLSGGDITLSGDSSVLFTGTGVVNMNNNKVTNVGLPTNGADAANKSYVDSLSSGIIWIQPIRDANLFNDSLSAPPTVPAQYVDYDRTFLVKPAQYTIVAVVTGASGTWTISGNHASTISTGQTFKVIGNADPASNATYTVVSATNSGANTNVVVSNIPVGATVSGTVLHASGDWNGLDGHVVVYDAAAAAWVDVLNRAVVATDRFGVFIDPNNYDPLSTLPAGGLAGHAGQIATISSVDPNTFATTWTFYSPSEPDAVSVNGIHSPMFGSSYTFRGTWGTGTYGTDYTWIEFAGPTAVVDGAGLNYQGNILYVGQGSGITVNANTVQLDTTYTNGLYIRRDGTTAATANLDVGGFKLTNVAAPTATSDATTKSYVDTNFQPLDITLTSLAAYNTNGILVQTAANTFAGRTLTGTANEVSVANGDGVSGNPTISLPASLTFTGKTITGGTYASVASLNTHTIPSGTGTLALTSNIISDIDVFTTGIPSASQVILRRLAVRTVVLDLAASKATAEVAATASTVFSVQRNGVEFGTITFAAAGTTGTFAVTSAPDQTHVAGDKITIVSPATPDATLSDLTITLAATLG